MTNPKSNNKDLRHALIEDILVEVNFEIVTSVCKLCSISDYG